MRLAAALVGLCVLAAPAASAQEVCLEYARGKKLGRMDSKKIDEASGLVASLAQPGVYWTHNDSGDSDRVFAVSDDGDYLGQWNLRGGDAEDWEDIAIGPCADGYWDCLYIADTGNNSGKRDELVIYRVREPQVDVDRSKPHDAKTDASAEAFTVTYPMSGKTPDAEALLVGNDGAVYVFTKSDDDVTLFRLWPLPADGERAMLEEIGTREDMDFVTGADMSPDGGRFVLRSAQLAWELTVGEGETVAEAFFGEPLELRLRGEQQGEAISYEHDGSGLLSTSEGEEQPIYRYRCAAWLGDGGEGKADGPGEGGSAELPVTCSGGAPTPLGGLLVLLVLGFLAITRWRVSRS